MSLGMKKFWFYWDKFGALALLILAVIVFTVLDSKITGVDNLIDIGTQAAVVGIAAAGMTFAICTGGFDLSAGAIISLSTCILCMLMPTIGMWPAVGITLLVGLVCGFLNGIIITKFKIQAFVATLATMMIFRGAAQVLTQGKSVPLTGNNRDIIKFFTSERLFGIIPSSIIIMLIVFAICYFVYRYTSFGVKVRSIGSNEAASRTSGIKVDSILIIVFMITAITASLAGIVMGSKLVSGHSALGDGFELKAITATVLGGTPMSGGKGNIWGTLVGALLVALIQAGLNMLGVPEAYNKLATGLVLLFSLTISGIKEITKEAKA